MTESLLLAARLVFGLASMACAAITPAPLDHVGSRVTSIAEGCAPDQWRDADGHCLPMFDGRPCPPGYLLGPDHKNCLPDR